MKTPARLSELYPDETNNAFKLIFFTVSFTSGWVPAFVEGSHSLDLYTTLRQNHFLEAHIKQI